MERNRMKYLRAQVIIHGIVQGVAFRATTRYRAEELSITGWVRNLPDGTVEALFEGEQRSVEAMIAWCHKGPLGSHVTNVEITREPYQGEYDHFSIRHGI